MIEVEKITKSFGSKKVLDELSLSVAKGEFLAIIGKSGEGKSVLLKNIIGLLKPDSGRIVVDGLCLTDMREDEKNKIFLKCGYVFQFAALLDSLNVLENVGIAFLERNEPVGKVKSMALEKLRSVGLGEDVLNKYPSELSGGMRKRVGLARTLMLNPEILLYDEPTTGLDPITVRHIHELMRKTHDELQATSIVISHSSTVFDYVDRVAMLYKGKIVYTGPAAGVNESDNPYIYQFIRGLSEGPIVDELKNNKEEQEI